MNDYVTLLILIVGIYFVIPLESNWRSEPFSASSVHFVNRSWVYSNILLCMIGGRNLLKLWIQLEAGTFCALQVCFCRVAPSTLWLTWLEAETFCALLEDFWVQVIFCNLQMPCGSNWRPEPLRTQNALLVDPSECVLRVHWRPEPFRVFQGNFLRSQLRIVYVYRMFCEFIRQLTYDSKYNLSVTFKTLLWQSILQNNLITGV